jgi:hypothetical protein
LLTSTASGLRGPGSHPKQHFLFAPTMSSGGGWIACPKIQTSSCVKHFRPSLAEGRTYNARIPVYTNNKPTAANKPAIRAAC